RHELTLQRLRMPSTLRWARLLLSVHQASSAHSFCLIRHPLIIAPNRRSAAGAPHRALTPRLEGAGMLQKLQRARGIAVPRSSRSGEIHPLRRSPETARPPRAPAEDVADEVVFVQPLHDDDNGTVSLGI